MARRRSNRFVDEAAQQALVRFGPEISGLVALQRQAEADRDLATRQAAAGAVGIVGAIDEAMPRVGRMYDRAGGAQARGAQQLIARDMAQLGNVADTIKASAMLETQAQGARLGAARAATLGELATRKVQAVEGANFMAQNALRQYESKSGELGQRRQDLRKEAGAFTAATAGQLRESARARQVRLAIEEMGNRTSRANALTQAGVRREALEETRRANRTREEIQRQRIAAGGAAGGVKRASPAMQQRTIDQVEQARAYVRDLRKMPGANEHVIGQYLTKGETLEDGAGGKLKLPQLPARVVSAALDLEKMGKRSGRLSPRNVARLRRDGIKIPREWMPTASSRSPWG